MIVEYFRCTPLYHRDNETLFLLRTMDEDSVLVRAVSRQKSLSGKISAFFAKNKPVQTRRGWHRVLKDIDYDIEVNKRSWQEYQLRHPYIQHNSLSHKHFTSGIQNEELPCIAPLAACADRVALLKRILHRNNFSKQNVQLCFDYASTAPWKMASKAMTYLLEQYHQHIKIDGFDPLPISLALSEKNWRLSKLLIKYKNNVSDRLVYHQQIVQEVLGSRDWEGFKFLIEKNGIDPIPHVLHETVDSLNLWQKEVLERCLYKTPAKIFFQHLAIYFQHKSPSLTKKLQGQRAIMMKLIRDLIEKKGVDPHTKDQDGNTILHKAFRSLELLKYLLDVAGCNPNAKNNAGKTPTALAFSHPFDFEKKVELFLHKASFQDVWRIVFSGDETPFEHTGTHLPANKFIRSTRKKLILKRLASFNRIWRP